MAFHGTTQHVKDGRPSDGGAVEQGRAEEGSGDPMAPVRGRRGAARARGGGGTAGSPGCCRRGVSCAAEVTQGLRRGVRNYLMVMR